MDAFIQIVFVLLILSMITEKITNLVKLRPTSWVKSIALLFVSKKSAIENADQQRSREIQTMAIIAGIVVALLTRASIFQIYNPAFELGWQSFDFSQDNAWLHALYDIFGCLLTGFFLSLGSKFFHDLLDLLLESKNLKRKLNDRESIANLHTIEEVDRYIAEVEPVLVEKKLEEYLQSVANFSHFEYDETEEAANVYLLNMSDEDWKGLKDFILVKTANKKSKKITLNYIDF